jgi:hypothetical protein
MAKFMLVIVQMKSYGQENYFLIDHPLHYLPIIPLQLGSRIYHSAEIHYLKYFIGINLEKYRIRE